MAQLRKKNRGGLPSLEVPGSERIDSNSPCSLGGAGDATLTPYVEPSQELSMEALI